MVRAVWNGEVIAESDDTVVVEGNHYFPVESVRMDLVRASTTSTVCPWKGVASYYTVVAGGKENRDAAWLYPNPKPAARAVTDRVAFWRGVKIEDTAPGQPRRSLLERFRRERATTGAAEDGSVVGDLQDETFDETFDESLAGHVTIIDFWAPWCGANWQLLPRARCSTRSSRASLASLRATALSSVGSRSMRTHVLRRGSRMSVPTLVVCDAEGREIDRLVGLADRRTLEAFVAKASLATT